MKFIPFEKANWMNVLKTCWRFYNVGKEAFDPSVNNNRAIRRAAETGNVSRSDQQVCSVKLQRDLQ
jgi:hypothetical protein